MTGCCAQNKTDGPHDEHTGVRTETLSLGGQLFIWSARRWLIAGQKKERIPNCSNTQLGKRTVEVGCIF